jgi:hypothetical protein
MMLAAAMIGADVSAETPTRARRAEQAHRFNDAPDLARWQRSTGGRPSRGSSMLSRVVLAALARRCLGSL